MRIFAACVCSTMLVAAAPAPSHDVAPSTNAPVERTVANDNTVPAGTWEQGVLTVRLEIREGEWHPDGDAQPGVVVHAFAEEGKPARVPGPLIRVPEGTEIRAFIRNTLDSAVFIHGLSARGGTTPVAADTVQVQPGAVRELRFEAGAAGTYYYWGSTRDVPLGRRAAADDELSGAFVVDPRGTVTPPRDRIFVIALWERRESGGQPGATDLNRFSINGRAWPNTERLAYAVGDTVRMRIVNTSTAVHPMHLHGFYFNVDSRGNGTRDSLFDSGISPRRVVTERLPGSRTFTMTWVPERPGNWMFHCHDNIHVLRNKPFDGSPVPAEHEMHVKNHALEMMGGLVMGVEVRDRGVALASSEPAPRRRLRLVVGVDTSARGTVAEPAYGYSLREGRRVTEGAHLLPGPTIVLRRSEPVSITVVNQLPEPTSVHWHGIELDSYYDGVAHFSGHPGRISPAIAPRDSFVARFTPPRSGTFMYHPHADELRQQKAGMSGAIVVVDSLESYDPTHDLVWLVSTPRTVAEQQTVYLNGSNTPAPLEWRAGERYRVRVVNIHAYRPSMIVRVATRDSVPAQWRAIAKDGMDLPPDQATLREATQQLGNGEAYDFEVVPSAGDLVVTVRSAAGQLLVSLPVRVR